MRALLGYDPSLAALAPLLIARTAGNPFFLEESVRTLVETGVLVGEPEALARALDDRARLGRVLAMMATTLRLTGDPGGAIATSRQALELAVALGDSALQVEVFFYLGVVYYALGDFGRATELLRWNVEAADRELGTLSRDVRIESRAWLVRLMRTMGLETLYPKPRMTQAHPGHRIYPYLLRDMPITQVNQGWSIDITYVRLHAGFLYLVAMMDWFSRYVLSWEYRSPWRWGFVSLL